MRCTGFRFGVVSLPVTLLATLSAVALSAPSAWGLELAVAGGGKSIPFPIPDGRFELSWIHSVERTEWRETFRVDRVGNILRVASEFASAGAGLPDRVGEGETFRMANGKMRLEGGNVAVGALRVRLSDVSRHYLRVGGVRVDLNEAFGDGVVTIQGAP